ncbi:hypothetical protein [Desulfofalx alkaliphila]|nr:hypothetical protein [Desulfofalx alkaliphila]
MLFGLAFAGFLGTVALISFFLGLTSAGHNTDGLRQGKTLGV